MPAARSSLRSICQSGIDGRTGEVRGAPSVPADNHFFSSEAGHLLLPAGCIAARRRLCRSASRIRFSKKSDPPPSKIFPRCGGSISAAATAGDPIIPRPRRNRLRPGQCHRRGAAGGLGRAQDRRRRGDRPSPPGRFSSTPPISRDYGTCFKDAESFPAYLGPTGNSSSSAREPASRRHASQCRGRPGTRRRPRSRTPMR